MDRRQFFKKTVKYGAVTTAAIVTSNFNSLLASPSKNPDLVAVKGGTAVQMFKKGIAAFGGMKEFVKKGQTVVVKPNIGWDVEPEGAANTNPGLVAEIIKHCLAAGAKKVYVFDHTCDNWKLCYKNSGIRSAVKKAGGIIVPGSNSSDYRKVRVPGGKKIKTQRVHRLIIDSDVFINVPVLKSHGSSRLTIGMKNLMGIVWERWPWHTKGLDECIAEFAAYRKPELTIVDAYRVLMKNGPRGTSNPSDVKELKYQVLSQDIVSADAAAAKIFGVSPSSIEHIKLAHGKKLGNMNLNEIKIKRISI